MAEQVVHIREKYLQTLENIATTARRAGRTPESVRLVVVSKAQPLEVVSAAIEAGAKILGENYAEEAVDKIIALRSQSGVEWHMIGHVQSRRARLVAEHFTLFQSLDSVKLADRIDRFASEIGRNLPVLLECNVGGEESKHGWPAVDESRWPGLLADFTSIAQLPHLKVQGLMTMPPLFPDPEATRPFFRRLHSLRDFLAKKMPQVEWKELSMGTSADYMIAIEEGATLVRVGQAILGPRPAHGD